jgi:hypothetical protein
MRDRSAKRARGLWCTAAALGLLACTQATPPPRPDEALTTPVVVEGAPRVDVAQHRAQLATLLEQMDAPDAKPSLCVEAGMAAYFAAEFDEAARLWESCLDDAADDSRVIEGLIQAHQARRDRSARDRYRERLFALRAGGKDLALLKARDYALDQFSVGTAAVQAFERFDPRNAEGIVYVFAVYTPAPPLPSEPTYVALLQENPVSTAAARRSGQLGPEDSVYELELVAPTGTMGTAGLYGGLPTYDTVRERVVTLISARAAAR